MLNVVQLLGYDCRAIQLHMQLYLPLLRPLAKYLQHAFRRASAGHKNALLHTVIYGVLEGVAKLHEHDVCHRDLKIDNVLVAGPLPPDAGQRTALSWAPSMMSAQLCDFGYSLMAGVNEGVDEARRLNPGTPPYIAPEVYDARQAAKADDACRLDRQGWQRADVYSTAMMLWGLCRGKTTGFFPSVDELGMKPEIKESKIAKLIREGKRPRLEPRDQDVDPGLQPLWGELARANSPLARGWSHDPAERPTAAELLQGILELDHTPKGGGDGDGGGGDGGGGGSGCQGGDEGGAAQGSSERACGTDGCTLEHHHPEPCNSIGHFTGPVGPQPRSVPKRQRPQAKSERVKEEGRVTRPRGRSPKGTVWDGWVVDGAETGAPSSVPPPTSSELTSELPGGAELS